VSIASLLRTSDQGDDFARLLPVSDRLARAFREIFSGVKVEVKTGSIAPARYTEWRITQNPFAVLLRFASGTRDDELVVHVPGYLISQLVDLSYGGKGQIGARGEFSPTEIRFIERVANQLLPHVGLAFAAPGQLVEMQFDSLAFAWPKSRDQIVLANLFIENPVIKSATITCFMDFATARQIGDRLQETTGTNSAIDPHWREKMKAAAMYVHMPARAVLTRAELPASQLLTLKPGDILPVLLPSQIPLTVAGRPFARGTIGEENGRAALKIEHIEGVDHE
jgi:flagellar motor switch protein FliM